MTEADTCRKFVVPRLQRAGWDNDPHSIVATATARIKSATARDDKMGFVCSLAQHLRNGLTHSVDPLLDIYRNRPLAIEIAGLAFCALRIAKHGAEDTL